MKTIAFNSDQFFAAARRFHGASARGADLIGDARVQGPLDAVALAPGSDFRLVFVYFDNDPEPTLRVPGLVVRRSAAEVRLAPVRPCHFSVGPHNPELSPRPPLCPARLQLAVWSPNEVIPAAAPISPASSVQQELVTVRGTTDEKGLLFVQAAGARSVRLWASNEGVQNAGGAVLRLRALRPEVPASADPRSDLSTGRPETPDFALGEELARLTLPDQPDGSNVVAAIVREPGCLEVAVTIQPASNDPVTVACGVEVVWG